MPKRPPPKPATSSDRSKASRLRRKRAAGASLSKTDDTWLRRYEADRKALSRARREAAKHSPTSRERSRLATLRRKRRDGRALSRDERAELRALEARTSRGGRRVSSGVLSRRMCEAIAVYVTRGEREYTIDVTWQRRSIPGLEGIVISEALWDEPILPDINEPVPEIPLRNDGRLANVRARLAWYDESGQIQREEWTSLVALTAAWYNIPVDLRAELLNLPQRTSPKIQAALGDDMEYGVTGVSVMVAPSPIPRG